MAKHWVKGEPDETWGPVRVADVVRVLRDLEPGFHADRDLWTRYLAILPRADHRHRTGLNAIMSRMGLVRYSRGYQNGRSIDPARLAERWPRYPWRS